jgi:Zn-dependent protease with chaperone function
MAQTLAWVGVAIVLALLVGLSLNQATHRSRAVSADELAHERAWFRFLVRIAFVWVGVMLVGATIIGFVRGEPFDPLALALVGLVLVFWASAVSGLLLWIQRTRERNDARGRSESRHQAYGISRNTNKSGGSDRRR